MINKPIPGMLYSFKSKYVHEILENFVKYYILTCRLLTLVAWKALSPVHSLLFDATRVRYLIYFNSFVPFNECLVATNLLKSMTYEEIIILHPREWITIFCRGAVTNMGLF